MPKPNDSGSIQERYDAIRERIEKACARSGRSATDVTLVAVSKTFPFDSIAALLELGHRNFGESKVQELVSKDRELSESDYHGLVRWHMIGHLQRNKVRDVTGRAGLIHSVDSLRLAREIDRRASAAGQAQDVLVQVNVSGEDSKFGLPAKNAREFVETVSELSWVVPRGLMTLAAPVEDAERVRPDFARMRLLLDDCNRGLSPEARMSVLSMGMSQDFEVAVEEGATHVRVGSAIFGQR